MFVDAQVIAFTLAAGVITLIPGQDTLLVVRNVLRGGQQARIVTTIGVCIGLFAHAMLSAVGVSLVLMRSAEAFQFLKFAGAVCLLWLGVGSLRTVARDETVASEQPPPAAASVPSSSAGHIDLLLDYFPQCAYF